MDHQSDRLSRMLCGQCSDCCVGPHLQLVQALAATLSIHRSRLTSLLLMSGTGGDNNPCTFLVCYLTAGQWHHTSSMVLRWLERSNAYALGILCCASLYVRPLNAATAFWVPWGCACIASVRAFAAKSYRQVAKVAFSQIGRCQSLHWASAAAMSR